jgi:translation elongation factor P/translation initiation factor 5A
MEFEMSFRGKDVIINVLWFQPATKGNYNGHPDNWYPAEPEDFEWEFLDEDGAQIYFDDMTRQEEREIEEEIMRVFSEMIDEGYGY